MPARRRIEPEDDTPETKRRRREEFERQRAENARSLAEARHKVFTAYHLWLVCRDKRCMRARACVGDTDRCLYERWHVVIRQETKIWLHKVMGLLLEGYSNEDALRIANEDIRRHREAAARLDAHYPAAGTASEAEQPEAPLQTDAQAALQPESRTAAEPPSPANAAAPAYSPPRADPSVRGPRIRFP